MGGLLALGWCFHSFYRRNLRVPLRLSLVCRMRCCTSLPALDVVAVLCCASSGGDLLHAGASWIPSLEATQRTLWTFWHNRISLDSERTWAVFGLAAWKLGHATHRYGCSSSLRLLDTRASSLLWLPLGHSLLTRSTASAEDRCSTHNKHLSACSFIVRRLPTKPTCAQHDTQTTKSGDWPPLCRIDGWKSTISLRTSGDTVHFYVSIDG